MCDKEYRKIYYERNREKIKEKRRENYKNNKYKEKEYYQNNKDKIKDKAKEYYQNNKDKIKEYYQNNKEHKKQYNKQYRKDNIYNISYRLKVILFNLKDKCHNHNSIHYKCYGANGIRVCEEWLNDSDSFIKYCIDNGYEIGLSIDRINTYGNYEQGNIRFISIADNCRRSKRRKTNLPHGVSRKYEKFESKIKVNNKLIFLGHFNDEYLAANAYITYCRNNNIHLIDNPDYKLYEVNQNTQLELI